MPTKFNVMRNIVKVLKDHEYRVATWHQGKGLIKVSNATTKKQVEEVAFLVAANLPEGWDFKVEQKILLEVTIYEPEMRGMFKRFRLRKRIMFKQERKQEICKKCGNAMTSYYDKYYPSKSHWECDKCYHTKKFTREQVKNYQMFGTANM